MFDQITTVVTENATTFDFFGTAALAAIVARNVMQEIKKSSYSKWFESKVSTILASFLINFAFIVGYAYFKGYVVDGIFIKTALATVLSALYNDYKVSTETKRQ